VKTETGLPRHDVRGEDFVGRVDASADVSDQVAP